MNSGPDALEVILPLILLDLLVQLENSSEVVDHRLTKTFTILQVVVANRSITIPILKCQTCQNTRRFLAKSVCYNIHFARVVLQDKVIILNVFDPSPLPQIKILLSEHVFQTLVAKENLESRAIQITSLYLEGEDYGCQLQVMSRVVFLTRLQLL